MFHARYLNFLERARTEWLRHIGFGVRELAQSDGLLFIVREMQMSYLRPAVLDDVLTVTAAIAHLGRAHFALEQRVLRGDEELVRARSIWPASPPKGFGPRACPRICGAALQSSMGWEVTQEEECVNLTQDLSLINADQQRQLPGEAGDGLCCWRCL